MNPIQDIDTTKRCENMSTNNAVIQMEIFDALHVLKGISLEHLERQTGFVEGMILAACFLKAINGDQEKCFRKVLKRYRRMVVDR